MQKAKALSKSKAFKDFYRNLHAGNPVNKQIKSAIEKREKNIQEFKKLYPNEIMPDFSFFISKDYAKNVYLHFKTSETSSHYVTIKLYGANNYQYLDKKVLQNRTLKTSTKKEILEGIAIKCLLKYIDLLGVSHTNTLYVYRVIYALTYMENIEGKEIHHINFKRKCNHPLNLMALTKQEHQAIHRQALEKINERLTAHNQKPITEKEMLDTSSNARWRKYPELYYIAENLQRENLEAPIPQDLNLIFANFNENKENNIKWVA